MQHLIFITSGDAGEPNEDRVKELLEALGLRSSDDECDCPFCQGRRDGKLGIDPSKLPAMGRVPLFTPKTEGWGTGWKAGPTFNVDIEKGSVKLAADQFAFVDSEAGTAFFENIDDEDSRVYKELVKRGWTPPGGIEYPPVKRNDGGFTAEGVAYIRGWNECRIATMHLNRKS